MTQVTAQATITSHTIMVEHIRISSGLPFAESAGNSMTRYHDVTQTSSPRYAAVIKTRQGTRSEWPTFMIEQERDHGALLQIAGGKPT
jgi:hypothetical protein